MLLRAMLVITTLLIPFSLMQAADTVALHKNDVAFVRKATVSNLVEIHSAEGALKRNLTSEEQAFAKQLIEDHRKANDELAAIAKQKGITPASELAADERMRQKVEKINGLKDKDFNEDFLEFQIDCHQDAIDLFKDQAEDGHDPELRAYAGKHLPHLQSHLETAKRLEAKY